MNEYTAKDFKKGQPRWCPFFLGFAAQSDG